MPKHGEKNSKREPLLTDADKIKQLGKEAGSDPATKEAMAILDDIVASTESVARNSAPSTVKKVLGN